MTNAMLDWPRIRHVERTSWTSRGFYWDEVQQTCDVM